uniref:Uncharacterized protein n=1 Tax=Romanomermis culicivorax TaxID=13658 RepID=A0A915KTJ4_ROMCU
MRNFHSFSVIHKRFVVARSKCGYCRLVAILRSCSAELFAMDDPSNDRSRNS